MKKSPKEIKESISSQIKDSKKHDKAEFEIAISKAFVPADIKKQKRLKSTIDENSSKQQTDIMNELKTNFSSSFSMVGGIFFRQNWPWIIGTIITTMFISFFSYGIVYGFLPQDALVNQKVQVQIAVGVYFAGFVLPTFMFIFWGVSSWILELRSDNLISRLKINGVTKIQFIVTVFIVSILTMICIELFICGFWIPLMDIFARTLMNPHEKFYLFSEVSKVMLIVKCFAYIVFIFFTSLTLGFWLESKKIFLNIVLGLFLLTVFNYYMDMKTYGDYSFVNLDSASFVGVMLSSLRWINPVYAMGSHLLTTLIPNISNSSIGNVNTGLYKTWFELFMNITIISLSLAMCGFVVWKHKVIMSFRALR